MKMLIIIVIAFLVLLYAYTYINHKKKGKADSIDAVGDFRKKYLKDSFTRQNKNNNSDDYRKYVTKYNSTLDYIEKDKLTKS